MAEQTETAADVMAVEIPDGLDLEVAEAPTPAPDKKVAAAAAADEPDRGNLGAALKESRSKAKGYADEWRKAEAEVKRLRDRAGTRIDVDGPNEDLQKAGETAKQAAERIRAAGANLRTRGAAADDLGAFASMVGDTTDAVAAEVLRTQEANQKAIESSERRSAANLLRERTLRQEEDMRKDYKDFDKALENAGIFEACKMVPDGKGGRVFANPTLAEDIYRHANPPRRAYELALGKAEADAEDQRASLTDRNDDTVTETRRPQPASGRDTDRGGASSEGDAERRGARKVIDQVVDNAGRQRGLRAVPESAGTPGTRTIDRDYLDKLMVSNPDGYLKLTDANPNLKQWHLGGF